MLGLGDSRSIKFWNAIFCRLISYISTVVSPQGPKQCSINGAACRMWRPGNFRRVVITTWWVFTFVLQISAGWEAFPDCSHQKTSTTVFVLPAQLSPSWTNCRWSQLWLPFWHIAVTVMSSPLLPIWKERYGCNCPCPKACETTLKKNRTDCHKLPGEWSVPLETHLLCPDPVNKFIICVFQEGKCDVWEK